jgi:glyoxylase-like metal-dependent hydrolase (beta-lactamase superfamily II)
VRRKLLIALGVIIALPLATVIAMRAMRHKYDPPVPVHGRLYRLRNLFTEIYGARVGDHVVLFDAGIDDEGPALDALLTALHAGRDDVSDVFLTHGHFDHVQASPLCKKARIHVGAADVAMLAGRARTEPFMPRLLSRILPPPLIEADAPYAGGELPLPDGSKVTAIPLPGHTPGSHLLLFDGVLIGGDSLQISHDELTWADPLFSADMEANRRNIRALKLTGVEMVCTGHQGCIGEGQRHLDELIARR